MKQNSPDIWRDKLPQIKKVGHKYDRGHALIYGAPEFTGATRLAAQSCARIGAGLTTVLGGKKADIYRCTLPAHIMVRDDLNWNDERVSAKLYGSGGLQTEIDYQSKLPTILDAEALKQLPAELSQNYILTPHEGEFAKAFRSIDGNKAQKAQKAAKHINAIILLKGKETVIAHPDGRIIINNHASPYLASAGTGDVLSGMVAGLCAQKIEPFYAACAAVWIHGEAGQKFGAGLVASDIEKKIPEILRNFS